MHEMSLAQNILDIARKAAVQHQAKRIVRISIRAGQLRGIIPEQLRFCFGFVAKDTIAEGSELLVRTLPIQARCKGCRSLFFVQEYKFVCSECGGEDVEVVQGMELLVENIEVDDG